MLLLNKAFVIPPFYMSKTRAIRFTIEEERLIQAFLKKNPFFDFSSLARVAVKRFIENPYVEFKSVKVKRSNNKGLEQ